MRIQLHALEETEDSLEIGDPLGDLEITEAGVEVRIEDPEFRDRVVKVLEEGLWIREGDSSGMRMITTERQVALGDPDYVTALLERFAKPDLRLHGEVV